MRNLDLRVGFAVEGDLDLRVGFAVVRNLDLRVGFAVEGDLDLRVGFAVVRDLHLFGGGGALRRGLRANGSLGRLAERLGGGRIEGAQAALDGLEGRLVAHSLGRLGAARIGRHGVLVLSGSLQRLAELGKGQGVIRVAGDDRAQALDGTVVLAVAQVDARFGQQLLRVPVDVRGRLLERLLGHLRLHPGERRKPAGGGLLGSLLGGVVGQALDRAAEHHAVGVEAGIRELGVLAGEVFHLGAEQHVVLDFGLGLGARLVERARRHEALGDVAGHVVVAALPMDLGGAPVGGDLLLGALQAVTGLAEDQIAIRLVGLALDHHARSLLGRLEVARVEPRAADRRHQVDAARVQLQHPHENPDAILLGALALQLLDDGLVLGDRLVGAFLLAQQVGDLHATGRIARVEGSHAAQQVERLVLAALPVVDVRGLLQRLERVGLQTHALVELGQGHEDVDALLVDLGDLLVEGDSLGVEAAGHERLGDLQVGGDRLVAVALLEVDVTDLQADVGILGIRLQEGLVVLQCLVERPLLEVLLSRLEDLPLVDRQGGPSNPSVLRRRWGRGQRRSTTPSVSAPRGAA